MSRSNVVKDATPVISVASIIYSFIPSVYAGKLKMDLTVPNSIFIKVSTLYVGSDAWVDSFPHTVPKPEFLCGILLQIAQVNIRIS